MPSAPEHTPADDRPKFFGRRKGKTLRPGRKALLEELLPRLHIPAPDLKAGGTIDPFTLFDERPRAVWLEIGFGGGEHLAAQAEAHPDVGFIGAEAFVNGIASFLRHAEDRGLANVRVFDDDVRLLLPALPEGCLDRAFVLFPDPWPKKRHADRRFIGPDNLDALARLLADGAELRVASDDPVYQTWVLRHAPIHPAFEWRVNGPDDWRARPEDWVPTRYEAKALRQGRTPMYFRFFRKPR